MCNNLNLHLFDFTEMHTKMHCLFSLSFVWFLFLKVRMVRTEKGIQELATGSHE